MTSVVHRTESSTALGNAVSLARAAGSPVLEIVVPVYNEQAILRHSVELLHQYLEETFPHPFRITIADNASTDDTSLIAHELATELPGVVALRLDRKGRGLALRAAWSASDAPVLMYMDVDLSTDLTALEPLVAPLITGHSDLSIGSRLARGARVVRGTKREVISRCYNLLLRTTMLARFSDAQCGFKAIRAEVAAVLLPAIEDNAWFFDTELLVVAQRCGLRIHEVPVDWVDDPDSRVHVVVTAVDDLRGLARLWRGFVRGTVPVRDLRARLPRGGERPRFWPQAARFTVIGTLCTVLGLALYWLLRDWFDPQPANLLSALLMTVPNTAANRRFTFGVRGPGHRAREQVQGLILFVLSLGVSSGALWLLNTVTTPSRTGELAALAAANLLGGLLRFAFLRSWVFRDTGTGLSA